MCSSKNNHNKKKFAKRNRKMKKYVIINIHVKVLTKKNTLSNEQFPQ